MRKTDILDNGSTRKTDGKIGEERKTGLEVGEEAVNERIREEITSKRELVKEVWAERRMKR